MNIPVKVIFNEVNRQHQGELVSCWIVPNDGKYISKDSPLLNCRMCGDKTGFFGSKDAKVRCSKCAKIND